MKILSIILLLTFFTLVISAQNSYFDRGYSLYSQKKYKEADSLFTLSIEKEQNTICDALRIRALNRIILSDSSGSFNDIQKAIALCTDNANVYYSQGNIFYFIKQYTNAINSYNQAIHLNPKRIDFYINRSLAYGMSGDTIAFKTDALFALSIDPDSWQGNSNLGYYYKNTKQFEFALPYFEKAIKSNPSRIEFLICLLECQFNLKHFKDAFELCDLGLQMTGANEQLAEILIFRAQINIEYKNKTDACKDLRKAFDLDPLNSEKYLKAFCK